MYNINYIIHGTQLKIQETRKCKLRNERKKKEKLLLNYFTLMPNDI